MHASIGNSTGIKFPLTSSLRRFHAALEGQSASDRRRRRRGLLAKRQGGESGTNAVRPDLFKNVLRSMTLKSSLTQRKRVLTKVTAILSFGADHGQPGSYQRTDHCFRMADNPPGISAMPSHNSILRLRMQSPQKVESVERATNHLLEPFHPG